MTDLLFDIPDLGGRPLCAETDPEAFFPEKGGSTREAKKLCGRCELTAKCLTWAMTNDEKFGVWGGLSESERRRLRREQERTVRQADISHGTAGGYRTHRRRGIPVPASDPCGCRAANQRAQQERRDRSAA